MSREWKPGDVAFLEIGCHANRHRGTYVHDDGWRYGDDQWVANDPAIVTVLRPLVVIDPEDREQVKRLHLALIDSSLSTSTNPEIRRALRSLATPPKREVYEHLVYADKGGVASALCGKVWEPNRADVTVLGKCPECEQLVIGGWVA